MRTIDEIKQTMCEDFMANETLAKAYGFTVGKNFNEFFPKVSVESVLLYIVAVCQYVMESLINQHYTDVSTMIDNLAVHRPRWYRDKVLQYRDGVALIADTDQYPDDSEGVTAPQRVVKYAAATESNDSSLLTIKVAGENGGELVPLADEVATRLMAYIREIKDAGVRISLVNQEADLYNCNIDIYYNAIMDPAVVHETVENTIKGYISGLPFNGEYSNMALVDVLQVLDGVELVEINSAQVQVSEEDTPTPINARYLPTAGYMKAGTLTINMKVYEQI